MDAITCQGPFRTIYKPHLSKANDSKIITPAVLYGGAGYGGKSHALRTATLEVNSALRDMGFPGRWGCLACKTYNELNDRQVRWLKREMGDIGRVRFTRDAGYFYEFYDPTLGGFFLRNADDPDKRKGVEFDWLAIDELTQFLRDEYDALRYTLRSSGGLPFVSFFAATNPDGIGHGWVKRRWIEGDFSEDQVLVREGLVDPTDFVFVPARAYDNPTFNAQVEANLRGFDDPMLVAARWEGKWDLAGGNRFSQFNRTVHIYNDDFFKQSFNTVAPPINILRDEDICYIFGSLDYGTDQQSASAFYLHAVDVRGRVWTFHELYMQGYYMERQAELIIKACEGLKVVRIYCDPHLSERDSDGISRHIKFRNMVAPHGLHLAPGINARIDGWSTLDSLLAWKPDTLEAPGRKPVWRIHESCRQLIRFMTSAPRDELRPEDVSRRFKDDHAGDSVRYFAHSYFQKPPELVDNPSEGISAAWLNRVRETHRREHEPSERIDW